MEAGFCIGLAYSAHFFAASLFAPAQLLGYYRSMPHSYKLDFLQVKRI